MLYPQKCVAAIHDISGFGKCSLTVILPILSAAGVQTSVIPTALLSTHTGGLPGYTYRDLTPDMLPIAQHWHNLGLSFDAVYSGFLGSFEQISVVSQIMDLFREKDTLFMVDPVMADNGRLYATYTPQMAQGMRQLCEKADIIIPNITEASFLLGEEFYDGPYDRDYIQGLLRRLSALGPRRVVLTGVWLSGDSLGAAGYDASSGEYSFAFSPRVQGSFPGTGDIFGSVLLASLLRGQTMEEALCLAVDFTYRSIERTRSAGTDPRYGVNFEAGLPRLLSELGLES